MLLTILVLLIITWSQKQDLGKYFSLWTSLLENILTYFSYVIRLVAGCTKAEKPQSLGIEQRCSRFERPSLYFIHRSIG